MAIFCTDETIVLAHKYRGFLNEAIHKQVSIIMGESEIMEEKHIKQFEEMLDRHFDYIGNINELSYDEKVNLLWEDIFTCIQVAFDKYHNKDFSFNVGLNVIEKEVATILTPLVFDDLFYYSRELRSFRNLEVNAKKPHMIVDELIKKLNSGKYSPEKFILKSRRQLFESKTYGNKKI